MFNCLLVSLIFCAIRTIISQLLNRCRDLWARSAHNNRCPCRNSWWEYITASSFIMYQCKWRMNTRLWTLFFFIIMSQSHSHRVNSTETGPSAQNLHAGQDAYMSLSHMTPFNPHPSKPFLSIYLPKSLLNVAIVPVPISYAPVK